MLMDPHISQQNLGIQKAVLVLNQKVTRPELKFNLTLPEVDLGVYRFHYILVSYFTCAPYGDLVWIHDPIFYNTLNRTKKELGPTKARGPEIESLECTTDVIESVIQSQLIILT